MSGFLILDRLKKGESMKIFWWRVFWKWLGYSVGATTLAALVMWTTGALQPELIWLTAILVSILSLMHRALESGIEYWGMKRMAARYGVDLEFFATVKYEVGWTLLTIRLNEEAFKRELEKRKLSWH